MTRERQVYRRMIEEAVEEMKHTSVSQPAQPCTNTLTKVHVLITCILKMLQYHYSIKMDPIMYFVTGRKIQIFDVRMFESIKTLYILFAFYNNLQIL